MCCESNERKGRAVEKTSTKMEEDDYCYLKGDGGVFGIYIGYTLEYGLYHEQWNVFFFFLLLLFFTLFSRKENNRKQKSFTGGEGWNVCRASHSIA